MKKWKTCFQSHQGEKLSFAWNSNWISWKYEQVFHISQNDNNKIGRGENNLWDQRLFGSSGVELYMIYLWKFQCFASFNCSIPFPFANTSQSTNESPPNLFEFESLIVILRHIISQEGRRLSSRKKLERLQLDLDAIHFHLGPEREREWGRASGCLLPSLLAICYVLHNFIASSLRSKLLLIFVFFNFHFTYFLLNYTTTLRSRCSATTHNLLSRTSKICLQKLPKSIWASPKGWN